MKPTHGRYLQRAWTAFSAVVLMLIISLVTIRIFFKKVDLPLQALATLVYAPMTAVIFAYLATDKRLKRFIPRYDWPLRYLYAFVVALGLSLLFIGLSSFLPDVHRSVRFLRMIQYSDNFSLFYYFVLVVIAPVLEEVLFRGIILDGFLKKYSPKKAILLSSLLFGLIHLQGILWPFIIVILLGWVYHHTRNLLTCIAIHAFANLTGIILLRVFFITINDSGSAVIRFHNEVHLIWFVTAAVLIWIGCYNLSRTLRRDYVQPEF